jgi:hypothetical protein
VERFSITAKPLKELIAREAERRGTNVHALGQDLGLGLHRVGRHGSVTYVTIDKVCCALGHHPMLIYGDVWLEAGLRSCDRDTTFRAFYRKFTGGEDHCRNGHPRTPINTHVRKDGYRVCRPCHTENMRRNRERRKRAAA